MTDDKFTRRDFLKGTLAGSSALVTPTIINYLGQSSPSSDKEFLEIRDGNFYLGGEKFIMKGANYITRDHPWELFEDWGSKGVKKELELAKNLGVNALRVNINYQYSTNNVDWAKPFSHTDVDSEYLKNLDSFLEIVDKKGMKVMPSLFDKLYWEVYEQDKREYAKEYLEQLVAPFADDERILAWDLMNEPDKNFEGVGKSRVESFLRQMSETIRSLDKNHPRTIGYFDPEFVKETAGAVDFPSFHHYDYTRQLNGIYERLREEAHRPILLQEFGLPTLEESEIWPHSEEDQKEYYQGTFERLVNLGAKGAMFWCLMDFPEKLQETSGNPFLVDERFQFYMGVFRTDYSKKPAAHVVEQYYKWFI